MEHRNFLIGSYLLASVQKFQLVQHKIMYTNNLIDCVQSQEDQYLRSTVALHQLAAISPLCMHEKMTGSNTEIVYIHSLHVVCCAFIDTNIIVFIFTLSIYIMHCIVKKNMAV